MVKDKPDQTRIYDQEGYRQRAACLCVKNESESEVCKNIFIQLTKFPGKKNSFSYDLSRKKSLV